MKTSTLLLLLLLLPAAAYAQGRRGPGGPGGRQPDGLTVTSSFSGRENFDSRSAGLSGSFGLGKAGAYSFSGSAGLTHHRTWTRGPFPGELYDADLGLKAAGPKWSFGAGARSNSDRPYASVHETDLHFDASTTLRRSGPHTLLFGVNYSSQRSFLKGLPFPYLAYSYVNERIQLFLPFSLRWKLSEKSELAAAYLPPKYFNLSLTRKVSEAVSLGLSGGVRLTQYLLAGRPDEDQILFLERPYAEFKVSVTPRGWPELAVTAGHGFEGRYFSGRQYDEHHGEVDVKGGPAAGLSARLPF